MSQNVWVTIMPFGPVTNFLLAQKFFSGQPSFQALTLTSDHKPNTIDLGLGNRYPSKVIRFPYTQPNI